MKIQLDNVAANINRINAYSVSSVTVSGQIFNSSLVMSSDVLIDDWRPARLRDLVTGDLEVIMALEPELVLLGTGSILEFPSVQVSEYFLSRRIGLEVMDTGAACRAYNFMIADDRKAVAALLIPGN